MFWEGEGEGDQGMFWEGARDQGMFWEGVRDQGSFRGERYLGTFCEGEGGQSRSKSASGDCSNFQDWRVKTKPEGRNRISKGTVSAC